MERGSRRRGRPTAGFCGTWCSLSGGGGARRDDPSRSEQVGSSCGIARRRGRHWGADVPTTHPRIAGAPGRRAARRHSWAVATPPRSKRSTTAITPRCSRSAATARQPRGRRGRPAADLPARPSRAEKGAPPAARRAWLFAIARNRCLTLIAARRDDRSRRAARVGLRRPRRERPAPRRPARARLPTSARLPDDQRAALVLSELGDLSTPRSRAVIGCPRRRSRRSHSRRARRWSRPRRPRTPCAEIRGLLERATGGVLRRASSAGTCGRARLRRLPPRGRAAAAAGSRSSCRSRRPPA